MRFSIKNFFSKCDQIRSFLWIWSHLLKKSLMGNFIFFVQHYTHSKWSHIIVLKVKRSLKYQLCQQNKFSNTKSIKIEHSGKYESSNRIEITGGGHLLKFKNLGCIFYWFSIHIKYWWSLQDKKFIMIK